MDKNWGLRQQELGAAASSNGKSTGRESERIDTNLARSLTNGVTLSQLLSFPCFQVLIYKMRGSNLEMAQGLFQL